MKRVNDFRLIKVNPMRNHPNMGTNQAELVYGITFLNLSILYKIYIHQKPIAMMTPASKSVYYFGFYLLVLGISLTIAPNVLLGLFQIPATTEVWIHVLGVVVFNIGLYYIFMAPANSTLFLTLSVYTRAAILFWFIVFVLLGWAPAQLILFGAVDGAGALWTYMALRKK